MQELHSFHNHSAETTIPLPPTRQVVEFWRDGKRYVQDESGNIKEVIVCYGISSVLNGRSEEKVLSENQGRILNQKIQALGSPNIGITEITENTVLDSTAQGLYTVNGTGEVALDVTNIPVEVEIRISNFMDSNNGENYVRLKIDPSVDPDLLFSSGTKNMYLNAKGDALSLVRQAQNVIILL